MKKHGFTLAEILLTLGIIGVITTLTMPVLVSNHQTKVLETGIKKTYGVIAEGVNNYMADNSITDLSYASFLNNTDSLSAFVNGYYRTSKICDSFDSCFAPTYRSLDKSKKVTTNGTGGLNSLPNSKDRVVVSLSDGASAAFIPIKNDSELRVIVDTNGIDAPNVAGMDLFEIMIDRNGVPYGTTDTVDVTSASPASIGKIIADNWRLSY